MLRRSLSVPLLTVFAILGSVLVIPTLNSGATVTCDVVASAASGHDETGNGTELNPYKTVARVLVDLSSGQTGCLHGYAKGSEPSWVGLYEETVAISKPGITLRSAPGEVAQIKGKLTVTAAATPANASAPGVTISNLVLDGRNVADSYTPNILAPRTTIVDNDITTRNSSSCLRVAGPFPVLAGPGDPSVVIQHNRIHDCDGSGVILEENGGTRVIENLIFDVRAAGIRLYPNADSAWIHGNIIDAANSSLLFGTGADANYLDHNVVSNPGSYTVGAGDTPGDYNYFYSNCVFKPPVPPATQPTDGFNPSSVAGPWTPGKIAIQQNVVADPLYANRAAEDFTVQSSTCNSTVGSVAAAVSDGNRPTRVESVNLRPNILFLVSDDQRADSMPTDLSKEQMMPSTMKLFRTGGPGVTGGSQFENGFATDPLCCPSRASIFSGRYVHNHGVKRIGDQQQLQDFDQTKTLQHYLHNLPGVDYYNGIYGKYLNAWFDLMGTEPHGFDSYKIFEGGYQDQPTLSNDPADCDPGESLPCPDSTDGYSTTWVASEGKKFIDAREPPTKDAQPWFLYLAFWAPHAQTVDAVDKMAEYEDRFKDPLPQPVQPGPGHNEANLTDKPRWIQRWTDGKALPKPLVHNFPWTEAGVGPHDGLRLDQLRTLRSVDEAIQGVFDKLKDTGEAEDTLAIYISDNGLEYREHSPNWMKETDPNAGCGYDPTSQCGLTTKAKPYLESVNVPLLMRWPANPTLNTNFVDPRLVGNIDLAPTALDALGYDRASWMDGYSMLGTRDRDEILTENFIDVASRDPDWVGLRMRGTLTCPTSCVYIATFDPNGKADSTATPDVIETEYREYYQFDPSAPNLYETVNLYGPNGRFGGGDDVGSPPDDGPLAAHMADVRLCVHDACP